MGWAGPRSSIAPVGLMTPSEIPQTGPLRVLIADESDDALELLRRVLEQHLGHDVVPFAVSAREAAAIIEREDPDVSFVMVHHDDEHALRLISEAVERSSGPVIAHIGNNGGPEPGFVARAAELGVSAYVSTGKPEDVQAAIEVALRRHRESSELSERVEELEGALDRRVTIERAKGILMERHSVDDGAAFELLREHARSSGRRVAAVAAAVVEGHALLPRN
jgi:AmiR/NasT family two-component response regulator